MNIYAQIFGILAMVFLINSYFNTKKRKYLFTQILSNIFFGIQYFVLNAPTAVINAIIAIVRSIVFYIYTKNKKEIPIKIFFLFELAIIVLIIITCRSLLSFIPLLIAALYTYGAWQKNLKKTYFIASIAAIIWIFYNLTIGAYVATIGNVIELISSINGINRIIRKKELTKK